MTTYFFFAQHSPRSRFPSPASTMLFMEGCGRWPHPPRAGLSATLACRAPHRGRSCVFAGAPDRGRSFSRTALLVEKWFVRPICDPQRHPALHNTTPNTQKVHVAYWVRLAKKSSRSLAPCGKPLGVEKLRDISGARFHVHKLRVKDKYTYFHKNVKLNNISECVYSLIEIV